MDPSRNGRAPWSFESHPDEEGSRWSVAAPLDPIETSGFNTEGVAQTFRHSGWARQRSQVYVALKETNSTFSRLEAFRCCGSTCFVLRSRIDENLYRIAASGCHDRFCLPCAALRSRVIAANVTSFLDAQRARFITLTLRHSSNTLTQDIDRLYSGFKELRRDPIWKKTQVGGVAFLEIKRSRDRLTWHPHLHILSQGKFIDGIKLARVWLRVTGDSHIVDVRRIDNPQHAIAYITKYASKPFHPSLFAEKMVLCEAVVALRGRRMALSFGNWKGLQMTEKPSEDVWEFLDTLEGIALKAHRGDEKAMAILRDVCGERTEEMLRQTALTAPVLPPDRDRSPDFTQLYLDNYHHRTCYP